MSIRFSHNEKPYSHWEYFELETGNRLRIVPKRGGLITEWLCNGRQILYFDQNRFQDPSKSVRGGIPVLFPICGGLPDKALPLFGAKYGLAQHGFARDVPWEIALLPDSDGILLSLSDSILTQESYPFSFLLEMRVKMLLNALEINITIYNKSKISMPFSFGLHPYFQVRDLSEVRIEGLPETCWTHLSRSEVETAKELKNISQGVDFLAQANGPVTLVDLLTGDSLKLDSQAPLGLTVVWTDPPRPMVCLEPWTSPREALISGNRKISLLPGAHQNLICRYVCN